MEGSFTILDVILNMWSLLPGFCWDRWYSWFTTCEYVLWLSHSWYIENFLCLLVFRLLWQNNWRRPLKKERSILAHSLRAQPIRAGRYGNRRLRWMVQTSLIRIRECWHLTSSFVFCLEHQPMGECSPNAGWVFPNLS